MKRELAQDVLDHYQKANGIKQRKYNDFFTVFTEFIMHLQRNVVVLTSQDYIDEQERAFTDAFLPLSKMLVQRITDDDLIGWIRYLRGQGFTPKKSRRYLQLLKDVYSYAYMTRKIVTFPNFKELAKQT